MEETSQDMPQMELQEVGVVKSEIKEPMFIAGLADLELAERMDKIRHYHEKVKQVVCAIEIFPPWAELLDGLEEFSHILVLYWPHLIDPERRKLKKVHPMGRKDLPIQGIFATCSPARPNPVLVSAVPLVERVGNILKVEGLEAVDGSPVLDIKPYVKNYYGAQNSTVPEWMKQIHRELGVDVF
jgi:tRNA-Thr(GGU) m(6)t(6)A37 methyltransferase TsaA